MPSDWVRVVTAPNAIIAESWVELLIANGIAAAAPEAKMPYFLAQTVLPVRVLVRQDQLEETKKLLEELVGEIAD